MHTGRTRPLREWSNLALWLTAVYVQTAVWGLPALVLVTSVRQPQSGPLWPAIGVVLLATAFFLALILPVLLELRRRPGVGGLLLGTSLAAGLAGGLILGVALSLVVA